jgi:hypothetical protein
MKPATLTRSGFLHWLAHLLHLNRGEYTWWWNDLNTKTTCSEGFVCYRCGAVRGKRPHPPYTPMLKDQMGRPRLRKD